MTTMAFEPYDHMRLCECGHQKGGHESEYIRVRTSQGIDLRQRWFYDTSCDSGCGCREFAPHWTEAAAAGKE